MRTSEIIDIIKNCKHFLPLIMEINENWFSYKIGKKKYILEITDDWKYFVFDSGLFKHNIKNIRVSISKKYATEKSVLSKFREVLRRINKFHQIICNKEEHIKKIEPIIKSYIKTNYFIETDLNLNVNFPKSHYLVNGRYRTTAFDTNKENPENVKYSIFIVVTENKDDYHFQFQFNVKQKKLILLKKLVNYYIAKDVTKIIRSEKLKNLMLTNEEDN